MRNFKWSLLVFFCIIFTSFSQTKNIEKGTYISTNKGQKIKLNLLDNNKYELVFYSGEYKIKGDSLSFFQTEKAENSFNLTFKNDKNAKKIKIKFLDPSYYSFYIGTQNGSDLVQYQKVSDIKAKVDPDWTSVDADFEIDRADYLYLVYEGYETESKIYKYALPKDVSEVTIKYELDAVGDLNISGFFDRKTSELMITEQSGKNPIAFLNEKDTAPIVAPKVTPIENKSVLNWTYPGKETLVTEDFGVAVDSAAAVVDTYTLNKFDFKFKIESKLKDALTSTKSSKSKFLVVYSDNKNPSAKADFDAFVKEQETQLGNTMYDQYYPEYDLFNYYLAGADDKKWLKTNKIVDAPSIIILNGDSNILATVKSSLTDKQYQFNYYDELYKKLQRVDAFLSFDKVLKNKKTTDADLISAFNKVSLLELPYDYDTNDSVADLENTTDFKLTKVALDKKEVSQIWKKLIEAHQKDTKPNKYLVETILKEIKNQGYNKQIFKEDRIFNDTDFLAIDYLIKHYDAIEKMNSGFENGTTESLDPAVKIGNLSAEISYALQQNSYVTKVGVDENVNKDKTIGVYKKLIAAGKGGFDCYKNYFVYLEQEGEKTGDYTAYLKEFDVYFDTYLSTEKGNAIQRLDDMYGTVDSNSDYSYNGWNTFKEYHSNLCNTTAWEVVLKPEVSNYIKKAINWSEYSLVVTKNNPYYLDTLAQLYYKDGQKDKAIATQTLAVKFLNDNVDEETAAEIKETLVKMQNGTY